VRISAKFYEKVSVRYKYRQFFGGVKMRTANPNIWLAMWVFLLAMACTAAGEVIYVDDDTSVGGNGQNWGTAFKYLQDGLAAASYGDEIRVAQGVYIPDQNSVNPGGSGDREETFQLANLVELKGSYAGDSGSDPNARDIETYKTILSGDLNGDDVGFTNNGENSYHVVCCSNISGTTVLDGFTITAGNANVNPDRNGGGMYNEVTHSNLIVTNCTFIGNSADNSGGGIFNYYFCDLMISDCTFRNNSADYDGGAIYNWLSMPILVNSMFIGNSAGKDGGGIFSNHSGPTLTNCTFIGNSADNYGGGIYSAKVYGDTVLINCIIWGNIAEEGPQIGIAEIIMGGGVTFVSYCDIQGAELDVYDPSGMLNWGEGNIGEDLVNDDPLFVDADNDDYHLKSQAGRWDAAGENWLTDDVNSPCIDAGDPNSDWTAELWPHGKRINMGAFGGTPQASMSESPAGNIADLNANDVVNYADLKLFTEGWLRQQVLLAEDLDRDGSVKFKDFAIFAGEWFWEE